MAAADDARARVAGDERQRRRRSIAIPLRYRCGRVAPLALGDDRNGRVTAAASSEESSSFRPVLRGPSSATSIAISAMIAAEPMNTAEAPRSSSTATVMNGRIAPLSRLSE